MIRSFTGRSLLPEAFATGSASQIPKIIVDPLTRLRPVGESFHDMLTAIRKCFHDAQTPPKGFNLIGLHCASLQNRKGINQL